MIDTVFNYNINKDIRSLKLKVISLQNADENPAIKRKIRNLKKQIKFFERIS